VLKGISGVPDVARLKALERELAEAAAQYDDLTAECVDPPIAGEPLVEPTYLNKAGAVLDGNDLAVRHFKTLASAAESAVTGERVNDHGRRWLHRLLKAGIRKKLAYILDGPLTVAKFEERKATGGDVEGYEPVEVVRPSGDEPTFDLDNPPGKPYKYVRKVNVWRIPNCFRASQTVLLELRHKAESERRETLQKATRPPGGRKVQYDPSELIALRESAQRESSVKLSKATFAERLGISEDTLYRSEETGLLTKKTSKAYVHYAKRKGQKIPTAISA
jgi:hypothetical protein